MDREMRKGLEALKKELAFTGFVELVHADPRVAYILADAYVELVKEIAGEKAVVRPGGEAEFADQKASVKSLMRKALPGLEVVTPEEAKRRDAEREAREDAEEAANHNEPSEPPKGTILN